METTTHLRSPITCEGFTAGKLYEIIDYATSNPNLATIVDDNGKERMVYIPCSASIKNHEFERVSVCQNWTEQAHYPMSNRLYTFVAKRISAISSSQGVTL
jgi:hypothetical protein